MEKTQSRTVFKNDWNVTRHSDKVTREKLERDVTFRESDAEHEATFRNENVLVT